MKSIPSWDDRFMLEAHLKTKFSKDPHKQVGAVVVDPVSKSPVASGWNGIARGVDDSVPSRSSKAEKAYWYVHAEENAICQAARKGVSLEGCHIYVTHDPCAGCARKIIQSGITRVFVDCRNSRRTGRSTRRKHGIDKAEQMFREAGVVVARVPRNYSLQLIKHV